MQTRITLALLSLLCGSSMASAGTAISKSQTGGGKTLTVSDLAVNRAGDELYVTMNVTPGEASMKGNREVLFTPMLVNEGDTLRMDSFVIAGRNRYYSHLRNDGSNSATPVYRADELSGQTLNYSFNTPYQFWMSDATLVMDARECGCCSEPVGNGVTPLAQLNLNPEPQPLQMRYVVPKAETVKMRAINARAYVDFPVNRVEIFPDYRRNPQELAKIRATIDSVRNDKNLTITSIHINGTASPEGSYSNNVRLAKGRTATLAEYVRGLYHFGSDVITTSYDPEDWAGLKEYVESPQGGANLSNREALLTLITDPAYDSDLDRKDALLKQRFPADYKFLLAEVYPALRHSDYAVNFKVREYTDPQEILQTMRTAPQNLSLQELYVAAQSQEPGSDLYNEAFEIAVRMYPDDPTANLNAACSALQRNDLKSAERYLAKAGDSQEAQYTRGLLEQLLNPPAPVPKIEILNDIVQLP